MLHNATLCYLFMLLLLFWRALCVSVTDCGSGIMPRIYIPCTLAGDGLDQSVPYLAGKDSLNTQTDEVHVYAGRIFCSSIFST